MTRIRATAKDRPAANWSRALSTLAGGLALALLVWTLGPAIPYRGGHPLEDPAVRLGVIAALVALWAGAGLLAAARARRANERMVTALASRAEPDTLSTEAELDLVRTRVAAVLERLRGKRFGPRWGRRYVYQLPWYLVLGAPGSGKTTAVAAVTEALGASVAEGQPVPEAGGTRSCDWWFSDRAVLIDTAGRYTTQDGRGAADGRVWTGLLGLLREHRPLAPVNGVILAVSLADLAAWTPEERRIQGHIIRARLAEMRKHLGVRLPVYVVGTKSDLVAGFTAFFDVLPDDERRQVWGRTLPLDGRRGATVDEAVRETFAALLERLGERVLDRLHQEPDLRYRAAAFGFPLQFAAIEEPLRDLLSIAWGGPAEGDTAILRGLYFTSARQDGAEDAIDPLGGVFGLLPPAEPDTPADGSAPFFLDRLLPDAVLPEAGLAGEDSGRDLRRRFGRAVALAAVVAATVGLGLFWANSYRGNAALIARAADGVTRAEAALAALAAAPRSLDRVSDDDVSAVVPLLDALRDLPGGYAERDQWPPLELTGGLYQGERIGAPARAAYARALRGQFLSRLTLRLEEAMRTAWFQPEQLAPAFRAYLMVGGKLPVDRPFLIRWFASSGLASAGGAVATAPPDMAAVQAASGHLVALLELGFAPVPLDDALVSRAQEVVEQAPAGGGQVRP